MRTMRDIVAEHQFFDGLAPGHLDLVAGCARNVAFDAGALILREGDPADTFYLLTHGRVAIELTVPGRGAVTVLTARAGDALGWSWLFPPHRWRYDAHAREAVAAIAFDGRCLREKAESDHSLGYELMRRFAAIVVEQLHATRLQLLDVYGHVPVR